MSQMFHKSNIELLSGLFNGTCLFQFCNLSWRAVDHRKEHFTFVSPRQWNNKGNTVLKKKVNVESRFCVFAEAGGAGQESFKHEGAAAERAPLPQTPPRAAVCVGISGAHPHRQHGLHHIHRLRARYTKLRLTTLCFNSVGRYSE